MHYWQTESHPEKFSSITLFIDKYKWNETDYPSKIDNWKMLFRLNILHTKEKETCAA